MAKKLAGTAVKTDGAKFDSKWAAAFYSLPKVASMITALKKKNGLEDVSTLNKDGSPKVLVAGFRLFSQRQSSIKRLTDLLKVLERDLKQSRTMS